MFLGECVVELEPGAIELRSTRGTVLMTLHHQRPDILLPDSTLTLGSRTQ